MAKRSPFAAPYVGALNPTNRFVTSWLLPPAVLFAIRALFSLYSFTTIFTLFGWYDSHGMAIESRHLFSYFTDLTYFGLAFYFLLSALHTGSYWLTGTSFLARWPKALQVAHSMFYSTIVVYPWVVTAVFWGLLAPSHFASTFALWSNVSQHALNSVFALFEIVFSRTEPLPWVNLVAIVIILALYLGLAYLTHKTEGFYVYDFLDPSKHSGGILAAYILGILVGAIIVFLIVRYVIVLRVFITEKKLHLTGKFSHHDGTRTTSEKDHRATPGSA